MDSLTFPGELDCTDCALSKMRTNVVPGALGERYDGVFIVGEAPGPDENERGFPFVGPSGRSMGEMLQEHGLHRSMFFFTNVAKCWPHVMGPKGRWQTIPPKIEEIRACFPRWFLQELHKLKPHTIVSLGGNALQAFLPGGKIGNVHGRTLNCIIDDYGEVKLIPLYHPAAAMHNPDLDVKVRADFAALPELLGAEAERDESEDADYTWVQTDAEANEMIEVIRQDGVSLDTETYEEDPPVHQSHAQLLGMGASLVAGTGWYIDSWHPLFAKAVSSARWALMQPNLVQILWNAAYDLEVLGVRHPEVVHDGMLMYFLLEEPLVALEICVWQILHIAKLTGTETKKKHGARFMQDLPPDVRARYGAADPDYAGRLTRLAISRLAALPDLWRVYDEIERPLIPWTMEMTRVGIGLDEAVLDSIKAEVLPALAEADEACRASVGKKDLGKLYKLSEPARMQGFNPGSSQQLQFLLFKVLGFKPEKASRTTGAPSADEGTIAALAEKFSDFPLWEPLLRRRELDKIRGTYVEGLRKRRCTHCGRLHTNLKQHGARTGRYSSADPDLQNIPVQSALGRRIQEALTA